MHSSGQTCSDWKNYEDKYLNNQPLGIISFVRMNIHISRPIYWGQYMWGMYLCWWDPGVDAQQGRWDASGTPLHAAPAIAEGCVGRFQGQGGVPKTSVVLCTLLGPSSVFSLMLNGLLQIIPLMSVRLFCNKMLSDKNMDIRIWPCLY